MGGLDAWARPGGLLLGARGDGRGGSLVPGWLGIPLTGGAGLTGGKPLGVLLVSAVPRVLLAGLITARGRSARGGTANVTTSCLARGALAAGAAGGVAIPVFVVPGSDVPIAEGRTATGGARLAADPGE